MRNSTSKGSSSRFAELSRSGGGVRAVKLERGRKNILERLLIHVGGFNLSPVSHYSGIFFVLTFALLTQSAWGQRIGPLVPDNPQRPKASSAERAAAVQPPSLQLSLPSPAAVALPPLGPDDLQRLQPREGRPPIIGVHRRLPAGALTLNFSGGAVKSTAEGAWQSTEVGRLWRLKMTSPKARAMRIHFRDFAIGSGSLWLHSEDGQTVGPYTGSGLYDDGDFWSGIVFGDSLTIEYLPDPSAAGEGVPFQIVAISHIWDDAFGDGAARKGDKGHTVGRAVRLPATAEPQSGKAAHARTDRRIPLGAGRLPDALPWGFFISVGSSRRRHPRNLHAGIRCRLGTVGPLWQGPRASGREACL